MSARFAALCSAALTIATLAACARAESQLSDADTLRAPASGSTTIPVADSSAATTAAPTSATSAASTAAATPSTTGPAVARPAGGVDLTPNELGRIPLFEYHLIGEKNATYERTHTGLRHDLEVMYARGYRPISISEMLDRKIDLPAGQSPVILVFDDASPSQFRYIEKDGKLEIDPTSAVGILLDFNKRHPDWRNKAVFCTLPAAQAGRSFFGDKGIEGQKSEWRFQKVRFLHEQGFELCNHTLYHARLDRETDARVQEFIARGDMAIDSVIPGYRVRAFALPLGMWPKNRALAQRGSWQDPKSKRTITYSYDAILEVAGGPARSPFDPKFNPLSIPRVPVVGDSGVTRTLNQLERQGLRYVSDGDPKTVAAPAKAAAN